MSVVRVKRLQGPESKRREKDRIRSKLIEARRRVEDRELKDERIQQKILESDWYRQSELVLVYVAKEREVATDRVLKKAIADKDLVVPVTVQHPHPSQRELQISRIESLEELRTGSFQVDEPRKPDFKGNSTPEASPDLLLVPGVGFSENKNRLGYGSGYFDKYLASISAESVVAGLAYERQVVTQLPVEDHDVPLDVVVTEERVIS